MNASTRYLPCTVDRYGGKALEYVVRKNVRGKRWLIFARTESYGGQYLVPVAWPAPTRRSRSGLGWKLKRDALAYLATLPQKGAPEASHPQKGN